MPSEANPAGNNPAIILLYKAGVKLWNALPDELKYSKNMLTLKKKKIK